MFNVNVNVHKIYFINGLLLILKNVRQNTK